MTQQEFQKKYGGEIKKDWLVLGGDLYCSNNQLTSLPEKLKVGGSLYCSNNQLTSLPEKLKVGGSLYCYNNQLTSLPEKLKVGGSLYCYNNQLKKIPKSYSKIKNLYVFQNVNWNDIEWINKILGDKLTAEEVFAIDNIEHRRIAFEYMDKTKMKVLKDYKILDEQTDSKGNQMKILSFTIQNMKEPLKFYNCICSSTKREFFIGTSENDCLSAKSMCWGFEKEEIEFVNEW